MDTTIIPDTTYTYHEEPKFEFELVFIGLFLLLFSLYFFNRWRQLHNLKKSCTEPVHAVVARIQSANSDNEIRYRYKRYNASYRYEFNGVPYHSNNNTYGSHTAAKLLHEGDYVIIHVDPDDPTKLYDTLAESSKCYFFFIFTMIAFLGLFVIFGKFIYSLLQ